MGTGSAERQVLRERFGPRSGAEPGRHCSSEPVGAAPERELGDHDRGAEGDAHRRGRPPARRHPHPEPGTEQPRGQDPIYPRRGARYRVPDRGRKRPRDAVQWALYYPPVLYLPPDAFAAETGWQRSARESIGWYAKGDITRAFEAIQSVPADGPDARFFAYRAHLLLMVGRVDEARANLGRALKLSPNNAEALALQTVVDLVVGERDKALADAQSAVQAHPQSAAELQSAFGELDKVQESARKAAELAPELSRTQTVLGFAHLTRVETGPARQAFDKAIGLDSSDPLRLGLGLAKIREGMLGEGGA